MSENLPVTSYTNRRYFAARENRDFVSRRRFQRSWNRLRKLNEYEDYLFYEQREKKEAIPESSKYEKKFATYKPPYLNYVHLKFLKKSFSHLPWLKDNTSKGSLPEKEPN